MWDKGLGGVCAEEGIEWNFVQDKDLGVVLCRMRIWVGFCVGQGFGCGVCAEEGFGCAFVQRKGWVWFYTEEGFGCDFAQRKAWVWFCTEEGFGCSFVKN